MWIKEAMECALENLKDYQVIGIFLHGSQNYDLADSESDFDFKAIVLPTFDDFYSRKSISTTIKYKYGQIDVKDVDTFFSVLFKSNPAYLEILLTEYRILFGHKEFWNSIFKMKERIIYQNPKRFVKACYGMMLQKRAALTREYPTTVDEIKEFGYSAKQRHHIIRLHGIIYRFLETGEYIIEEKGRSFFLMSLKREHYNSLEDVVKEADQVVKSAKFMVDKYCGEKHDEIDGVIEEVRQLIKQEIKASLAAELEREK